MRSWWHPPSDDWLLEEEFRREHAVTQKGQLSARAALVPEDGALPVQQIQHAEFEEEHQRRRERGDNFLFRPQSSEEMWNELPSWARSYWKWHATIGSGAKRVLIYHPPMTAASDGFASFYDAVSLAAETNRFFLVHWGCENWLAPSLRLDWRVPTSMRTQPLPAPVDQYRVNLLQDNPTDIMVVQSVIPEEKPGYHRLRQQREHRTVWKALFRPTSELQEKLLHIVQTGLDNRPYAAVWMPSLLDPEDGETRKELVVSTALQTVQCAQWLWEQAHHHGDPPMIYLVLHSAEDDLLHTNHHPTAMEQRLDRAFAEIQPNIVVASTDDTWTNVYLAAGADCLLYGGTRRPLAAVLSETDCLLPYQDCPVERLRDTKT